MMCKPHLSQVCSLNVSHYYGGQFDIMAKSVTLSITALMERIETTTYIDTPHKGLCSTDVGYTNINESK